MFKYIELYSDIQDLREMDFSEDEIIGYLDLFLEKYKIENDLDIN